MTYEEVLWKISTSPFLIIGQIAFWVIVGLFFMAGARYFWAATKYLMWKVERARILDEEHNAWVADQEKRADELLKSLDNKCYPAGEVPYIKGQKKSETLEDWNFNEVAMPRIDPDMPGFKVPDTSTFVEMTKVDPEDDGLFQEFKEMPKVDIEAEDPFHEFKESGEDEYDEVFTAGSSDPIAKYPAPKKEPLAESQSPMDPGMPWDNVTDESYKNAIEKDE